jgi:hypothetical protein
MDATTLEAAFQKAFAVFHGKGTTTDFFAFLDDAGYMIDEDVPFVLDKSQFREHVEFHMSGMWSSLEAVPREPRFTVVGTTGVISANLTIRGKPRDSGFRLRHCLMSLVCYWDGGQWRALSLNIDPLSGHIVDASPG